MSCGFTDCGRPDCPVCKWGRFPYKHTGAHALIADPVRKNAKADLKEKKTQSPTMPRRRHRVGPHH